MKAYLRCLFDLFPLLFPGMNYTLNVTVVASFGDLNLDYPFATGYESRYYEVETDYFISASAEIEKFKCLRIITLEELTGTFRNSNGVNYTVLNGLYHSSTVIPSVKYLNGDYEYFTHGELTGIRNKKNIYNAKRTSKYLIQRMFYNKFIKDKLGIRKALLGP